MPLLRPSSLASLWTQHGPLLALSVIPFAAVLTLVVFAIDRYVTKTRARRATENQS